MTHRLSKSKLIAFRQCEKRLWLEIHRPDLRVEDESAAMRFEVGHRLGELARTQYLDGTLIATGRDLKLAAKLTKAKLLETPRKAIFEATFEAAGRLDPTVLRTLDAVHLAAALDLGDDLEGIVT